MCCWSGLVQNVSQRLQVEVVGRIAFVKDVRGDIGAADDHELREL